MSDTATCRSCGDTFEVSAELRERFPGWKPKECPSCYGRARGGGGAASGKRRSRPKRAASSREENLTLADVLLTYSDGPDTGVFTDGSANPNPGPGGWGAVYVDGGEVIDQAHGHEPDTTNNRMELKAVIEGMELVPVGTEATIYSDSKLVVNTLTQWAAGWKRRGWKRKTGPVENLDLVREAFEAFEARPELTLEWIKAHDGSRWNEYADSLSTAYSRDEL
jgi:ribonuclease HI